jgi:hypothetical protein
VKKAVPLAALGVIVVLGWQCNALRWMTYSEERVCRAYIEQLADSSGFSLDGPLCRRCHQLLYGCQGRWGVLAG